MVKKAVFFIFFITVAAVAAFLIFGEKLKNPVIGTEDFSGVTVSSEEENPVLPVESESAGEITLSAEKLAIPPEKVKAIYATAWSAGSASKVDYLLRVIKETGINAIVIDIKDFSGYIAYRTNDPEIAKYKTESPKIKDVDALIAKLHAENVYVIARVVVFQDPVLAIARPDLAVKDSKTGEIWVDNKKLAWMDPSSKEVWDYNIAIAKNAFAKGFDEVNFDYVRFPSDGALSEMSFPFYNGIKTKREAIKDFFVYLREALKGEVISADLFGLVTSASDDMGIGQYLEDAYGNFDFICPMVYPSHFASGFIGYKNPAAFPYEVVKYSGESAEKRIQALVPEGELPETKLRPWLQDFNLGYEYGEDQVRAQIKAVEDTSDAGWMMWDPKNNYDQKEGFKGI
ncbi:MAG: putative glycoside hydrolase [Parcubacteria group bacterium]